MGIHGPRIVSPQEQAAVVVWPRATLPSMPEFAGSYGKVAYIKHSCTCGFVPIKGESSKDIQFSCKCKTGLGAFNAHVQKGLSEGFLLGILIRGTQENNVVRILKMVDMLIEETRTALELAIKNTNGAKHYCGANADLELRDVAYNFCSASMIVMSDLVRQNMECCFRLKNFRDDVLSVVSYNLTKDKRSDWPEPLLNAMVEVASLTILKNLNVVMENLPAFDAIAVEGGLPKSVEYMLKYMYSNRKIQKEFEHGNGLTKVCQLYLRMLDDVFQNEIDHAEILASMGCGPLVCEVHKKEFVFNTAFAGRTVWRAITSSVTMDIKSLIGNVFLRSMALSCMPAGRISHNDLGIENVCVITGSTGDRIGLFGNTYEFPDMNVKFIDCGFASSPYYKHKSGHGVQTRCIYPFCVIDCDLDFVNPGNFVEYLKEKLQHCRFCSGFPTNIHTGTMRNMIDFNYNDFVQFCTSIISFSGVDGLCSSCAHEPPFAGFDDHKAAWSALELVLSPEFREMAPTQATQIMMDLLKIPQKKGLQDAKCDLDYNLQIASLRVVSK